MADLPLPRDPPARFLQPRPSRFLENEAIQLPVTACRRCRKQKLRCSRDLPMCKRCRDISAVCDYPPPPDRKLLAAQRAKVNPRREPDVGPSPTLKHQSSFTSDASRPGPSSQYSYMASVQSETKDGPAADDNDSDSDDYLETSHPPLQASLKSAPLPTPEVARILIDIYFSHLYNASLLFHKPTFLSDYAANKVPDFIILSIFALGSLFMREPPESFYQSAHGDDRTRFRTSTFSVSVQGEDWAIAAGQRVLMQADEPSLETVQAASNVALYWWATGQTSKTHIHSHVAWTVARTIGLHIPAPAHALGKLSDEMRRRAYWACFINMCIGQENAPFKAEPWRYAIGVRLPADESSYLSQHPITTESWDEEGLLVPVDGEEVIPRPSIYGELIKLFCIWWEIQHFLRQTDSGTLDDTSNKVTRILEFDRQLAQVFDNFHPDLQWTNTSSFNSQKVDAHLLFYLHSVYRSCACILHSSIVPLFSSRAANSRMSKKMVRLSAEEAVKHASSLLEMADAFLSAKADPARLPSVAGFAMFIACVIQFKSLGAQRKLQVAGTSSFTASICVLSSVKLYWTSLREMWESLKSLFTTVGLDIDTVPMSIKHGLYYQTETLHLHHSDQHTDLDKILSHVNLSQTSGNLDLFAYADTEEAKGLSPRRDSSSDKGRKSKSAQNTPSPGVKAVNAPELNPTSNQSWQSSQGQARPESSPPKGFPVHFTQSNSEERQTGTGQVSQTGQGNPFAANQYQSPNPGATASRSDFKEFKQAFQNPNQFFAAAPQAQSHQHLPQKQHNIPIQSPSNFMGSLTAVPENYQYSHTSEGIYQTMAGGVIAPAGTIGPEGMGRFANMPGNTGGRGGMAPNMSGNMGTLVDTEMENDEMGLWWNQPSYAPLNPEYEGNGGMNVDGGTFQFGNYPFG